MCIKSANVKAKTIGGMGEKAERLGSPLLMQQQLKWKCISTEMFRPKHTPFNMIVVIKGLTFAESFNSEPFWMFNTHKIHHYLTIYFN